MEKKLSSTCHDHRVAEPELEGTALKGEDVVVGRDHSEVVGDVGARA